VKIHPTPEQESFIAELFAKNRAKYGDARMEDAPPAEVPPVVEGEKPPVVETSPEGTPKEEELPEHWRKELTKVRGEAARYRTSLRETEAKLATAKTPEEFATAVAEFQTRNAELERQVLITKVAGKHELPADIAVRLVGNTEAELEADAKKLAGVLAAASGPANLEGGLDPSLDEDNEMNPRKLAEKNAPRRRL
jgi:hypothetical protein